MADGWKCPVCARGVAPGEKTCDHGGQLWTIMSRALPDTHEIRVDAPWRPTIAPTAGDPLPDYPRTVSGGSIKYEGPPVMLWNGPQ